MSDIINIRRVEFLLTKRCNANCKHCSVPINKDLNEDSYADMEVVKKCFEYLADKYPLTSTMIYGGEPLLYIDNVVELFKIASKHSIPSIDLITSGFLNVRESKESVNNVVDMLSFSGVKRILLSVDSFHQERIPIELVEIFLDRVVQLNFCEVQLHPAWLVSKKDNNLHNIRTCEILEFLSNKYSVKVSDGNYIIPSGSNKKNIGKYYGTKEIQMNRRCGEIPYTNSLERINSIRILPEGNVNICRGVTIGNIFNHNIREILESYSPDNTQLLDLLHSYGVQGVYELAMKHGSDIDVEEYYGICDFCADLIRFLKERGIT